MASLSAADIIGLLFGPYTILDGSQVPADKFVQVLSAQYLMVGRTTPFTISQDTVLQISSGTGGTVWIAEDNNTGTPLMSLLTADPNPPTTALSLANGAVNNTTTGDLSMIGYSSFTTGGITIIAASSGGPASIADGSGTLRIKVSYQLLDLVF